MVSPNALAALNVIHKGILQWPYTYDSCDVGTAPNQTFQGLPLAATVNGDAKYGGVLSFLPGQRLSRCTCPGESHPGPVHKDGTFVGRSAPEIDVFEAQVKSCDISNTSSRQHSSSGYWEALDWRSFTICSVGGKLQLEKQCIFISPFPSLSMPHTNGSTHRTILLFLTLRSHP